MSKPREFFADSGCYYITENDGTNEIEPEEMLLIEKYHADKLAEALDDGLYLYCEDKSTGGCMQCQTCTYIEETIKPALKEYRGEK